MNVLNRQKSMLSKPSWIRIRWSRDDSYSKVEEMLRDNALRTVCQEARCPNRMECWGRGTATFLILGDVCTRRCRFCAVKKGIPGERDASEPFRIARTLREMGLGHVVITSVTRDDLDDGGAAHFADTVRAIRSLASGCTIEVLIPDFKGSQEALKAVINAGPDVIAHNIETVPRLYSQVRPQADYHRSLQLLARVKKDQPAMKVKSGIMLGFGESIDEVRGVLADLRQSGCDMLTVGQYLQPSGNHFPVIRFWPPDEFSRLKDEALAAGFSWVESGPLVRSSYRAERPFRQCNA